MQRGLPRRVCAANQIHVVVFAGQRFGHRRAVVNARAGQFFFAGNAHLAPGNAGRNQKRMAGNFRAVPKRQTSVLVLHPQFRDFLTQNLDPEPLGLRDRPPGQVRAAEAARKAEIVLDARRRPRLSARRFPLDEKRFKALRRPVNRRRQTGRAAADNHKVVKRLLCGRSQADFLR